MGSRPVILEKHKKYGGRYGANELFWGLGIEEETYLEFVKRLHVAAPIIRTNHKSERYSVDYYKSYKAIPLKMMFETSFTDISGFYTIPFFLNGHALHKMDFKNEHKTTYEKTPQPNPKFEGKTLFEELQEFAPSLFKDKWEQSFTFDGDTVEFITQNFYKVKVKDTIKELKTYKDEFLKNVNLFLKKKKYFLQYGAVQYPSVNPGFAVYYSNPSNIAMFNNGTYHINITLPSFIGPPAADKNIPADLLYPELFIEQHKKTIILYQWLEPLFIGVFGTPDPFATQDKHFVKGSQRCALSRYIGIGTYDTTKMTTGKILTVPIKDIRGSDTSYWWYSRYHKESAYSPLDKIGMDINFNKHFNHGIELRCFDWFPEEKLYELLEFLVYAAEAALIHQEAQEPVMSQSWNNLLIGLLEDGTDHNVPKSTLALYEKIMGIELIGANFTIRTLYEKIAAELKRKYKNGAISKLLL